MEINRNNYETFFLLYLDGELDAAEQSEVEGFLREHADLQKEFRLLQHTIQRPVDTVFEPKELLYRREEKRRAIPVYWARIAAAVIVIFAGGWFTLSILKNHKTVVTTKDQSAARIDTKKNHPDPDALAKLNSAKPESNQTQDPSQRLSAQSEIKTNPDRSGQRTNKGLAENTHPGKTTTASMDQNRKETVDPLKFSAETPELTGDAEIVLKKSGTSPDLQTRGNRNAEITPGHLAGGTHAAPLLIVAGGNDHPADNGNEQLTDIQTDNAISVIALDDRNKGITSFLKKLTKRTAGNETVENTKKLRVSIFQISY